MSLDRFQRFQYICVKCICSRSIGNNSVEWLLGIQKATQGSSLAYPVQRFMGPQRGDVLGWGLASGRASWWFPAVPAALSHRNPTPGRVYYYPHLPRGSATLSCCHLIIAIGFTELCLGKRKMSLWVCEHMTLHEKEQKAFFWCQRPCPIACWWWDHREVPSLCASVNTSVKWELEEDLEGSFQVDGSITVYWVHSWVLCLKDTKMNKASPFIEGPTASREL